MAEKRKRIIGRKETSFRVKVHLHGVEEGEKAPPVKAYLFSSSGEPLDSKMVSEKGSVTLKTKYGFAQKGKYRITVGPDLENTRELKKAGARSTSIMATIGKAATVVLDIYRPEWEHWHGYWYTIVGDVKKKINPDADTTIHAPVCTSIVEIYEVDYVGFVMKLPDSILDRFRDKLERIPEIIDWPHPPLPDPPPFKKPFSFKKISGVETNAMAPAPESPTETQTVKSVAQSALSRVDPMAFKMLPAAGFRNYLIDNIEIFRPYICLYLAGSYPKTLIATANTDTNGHFSTSVYFFTKPEQPDLYFKVKQCVSGSLRYVYAPKPVPCHTYWNHPSGKEVHLIVTDPQARCHFENPSVDKPGIYVMPIGIGNDGWWKIHQSNLHLGADSNQGLYHPSPSSTFDPYGKVLDLTMQFHDGLRNPSGPNVLYYRWSYRKDGGSGWTNIDTPVVHRYLDQTDPLHPKIKTYKLGPNPNPTPASSEDNLFEVPPDLDWYVENDRRDRPFAKWDTSDLPDGKYTLKLEMFDAAGNKVTPAGAGFKFFLAEGSLVDDEWPVNDSPHIEADGSILFHVHVDNTDTTAIIESVGFSGTTPTECQFLEYTDFNQVVEVKYQAYHAHGFLAHYNLKIKRGISGSRQSPANWLGVTNPAGPPATTPAAEGLPDVKVGELLDAYSQCAFSVTLHTYPRTRNGYHRIREYEASHVGAFALVAK